MPNTRNDHPSLFASIIIFLLFFTVCSSVAMADDVAKAPRLTS